MIAAGDAGVSVLGSFGMSHFVSPHFGAGSSSSNDKSPSRLRENSRLPEHHEDSAIDLALCAVPLPDGLMTRLGMLVYTMPEEAPDQVDWLGC
jgi:hypothetical protein